MKFKFSEMYKIKMNIDLTKCREYHGAKHLVVETTALDYVGL
jgi:hypothetical protein